MKNSATMNLQIERVIGLWPKLSPGQRSVAVKFIEAMVPESGEQRAGIAKTDADDQALLEAARKAQHEGDSFEAMYQTAGSVSGVLELLAKLTGASVDPPEDTNWAAIANLIEDAARRNMSLEAALYSLMLFEREGTNAE